MAFLGPLFLLITFFVPIPSKYGSNPMPIFGQRTPFTITALFIGMLLLLILALYLFIRKNKKK